MVLKCDVCGDAILPVWFVEQERNRNHILTGRERDAVSHLECVCCGKKIIVDDSMNGQWRQKRRIG